MQVSGRLSSHSKVLFAQIDDRIALDALGMMLFLHRHASRICQIARVRSWARQRAFRDLL